MTTKLKRGNTTIATASQPVKVTVPPSIEISGLADSLQEGNTDSFTVKASNLVSSSSYTIEVTTNNSDIGFNSSCSDRREDSAVPSNRTTHSASFTLYGCETTGGTVTAKLKRGSTTLDTATQKVDVSSSTNTQINSPPSFGLDVYSFTASENAAKGLTVGTVSATDPDTGDKIAYSIIAGNSAGRFSIGSTTGKITVPNTLDYEMSSIYELLVKASDPRDTTSFDLSTITIAVTNVNEGLAFDLDAYEFAIPISSRSSTDNVLVGGIRAADPDAEDIVTYSISSGNVVTTGQTKGPFVVDGLGRIWAIPSRLPKAAKDYVLKVQASDGNSHTDTTTVKVTVTGLPIATLEVDYDRLVTGGEIETLVRIENGTRTASSDLTLTIADSSSSTGVDAVVGASSSASFRIGSTTVTQRDLPGGRAFDFSIPSSASKADLPIPSARVPSSLTTGSSYLHLVRRTTSSAQFVVSRGQIPLVMYDNEIAIGKAYSGDWGFVPSITQDSEPNERRFSLNVPSSVGNRKIQIDLTSGDRDPVLVLRDDDGNVVEWNDDGGAGPNAKIVRQVPAGDYEIVVFTHWAGGRGSYELRVSYSEEPLTDPDRERSDITDAPFYESGSQPTQHSITGTSWKNSDCTSSISTASQGDVICVDLIGTGFAKGDSAQAVLFVDSVNQGLVPVGAIALKYKSETTMRGMWFAQHFSRYEKVANGPITYRLAIAGHQVSYSGAKSPTLEVRARIAGISGQAGSCPSNPTKYADVYCWLRYFGLSNDEILQRFQTIWTVTGQAMGYESSEELAVDFIKGALLGEGGIGTDRKPGYYVGWIVIGTTPFLDVPADIRDLAIVSTDCSELSWLEKPKCLFVDLPVELAVDGVSIVPVLGKIGDGAQIGWIIARAGKSARVTDEAYDIVKSSKYIAQWLATGRVNPWAVPSQLFRGHLIQDLRRTDLVNHGRTVKDLDRLRRGNMPTFDFVITYRGGLTEVVSLKTIDPGRDSYKLTSKGKVPSKFTSRLDEMASSARLMPNKRLMMELGDRKIHLTNDQLMTRRLELVIPEGTLKTSTHGKEIIRWANAERARGLKIEIFSMNSSGDAFRLWHSNTP